MYGFIYMVQNKEYRVVNIQNPVSVTEGHANSPVLMGNNFFVLRKDVTFPTFSEFPTF